jgi:tetraacyldisaccharide 4'-kinase
VITRKSADAAAAARVAAAVAAVAPDVPQCTMVLEPAGWRPLGAAPDAPAGPCIAVAAIGEPAAFLANARVAGADIERALLFGDHHEYTSADAARIGQVAGGRGIVTTEKDALKLEGRLPQVPVWALRQAVRIETGATALDTLIDGIRR